MNTILVSNIPAPYREPVYEAVAKDLAGFMVLYCQPVEPDRQWKFLLGNYPMKFLKGTAFTYNRIYSHHVHWNPGIWAELNRLDPAVVITNGYNPSHLVAFLWARFKGRKHVAMTDGWLKSEEHLTFAHRALRWFILSQTAAFIGASNRSLELLQHYGAKVQQCFLSYLCGNNDQFPQKPNPGQSRPYDLMFSGQFIERKMPFFFCEVAELLKKQRGRLRVLLIGDGPLREETLARLAAAGVEYDYPGFLSQEELPARYASAKIFLFPTLQECWGVVVNEACAAGTPVITCDNTAVDGELIDHEVTGLVLPLDAQTWAHEADKLLTDPDVWTRLSLAARERVGAYTYSSAAKGIVAAIRFVENVSFR